MKRKIMLLICLVLFIVSIACVSASEDVNQTFDDANDLISGADTLSVSQSDDEILGSADNGTFTALQKKIDDADEGAVINLENDYVASDEKWSIGIGKSLTINGNGHTIDGGTFGESMLYISCDATNVLLKNINFINREGDWRIDGGGIYSESGNLTIDTCNFDNVCTYCGNGGVIYSSGGLSIIASNFTNNHVSSGNGGVIYSSGGLSIIASNFTNNHAFSSCGGVIYSSGGLTVDSCSFEGNSADVGGVIYCTGDLSVSSSNFVENSVEWMNEGTAIYSTQSLYVVNSNFDGNNGLRGSKSAIYSETNENVKIINTTFVNNSNDYCPEDIYTENIIKSSHISLDLNGNTFLLSDIVQIDITLDEGVTGEVIVDINGKKEKLTLENNHASLTKSDLSAGSYDVLVKYGGDDSFSPGEKSTSFKVVEVSFNELRELIADLGDGDILNLTKDYTWDDYTESEIYINKSITIDGQGYTIDADKKGRIFNINSDNVVLKNINFINGFADESEGGAIYSNGNLTVINCSFQDCYASEYHGGAIYSKGNLTVIGSNFTNNGASSNGGAIYSWGNLTVIGSNFINNEVYSGGGAIYSRINLTVIGSNFINNYAMYNGGAIFSTGTICFIGSNFINNVASSGGASYSTGVLTVVGSNFTNNEAYSGGGAIFSTRDLTVIGSNFTNDNAESGGAIYSTGVLTVIGSNFTNDNAESGGAIYSTGDNCLINNSKFIDNTAVQYGGAIYSSGNLTVIGSNFTNNSAGWSGGAIYSTGVLTVIGSNFTNNTVTGEFDGGGAIYSSGNLTVNSSNFTNNSAEFGGAILSNSVLTVNSSNFTNNTVTGEFDGGGAIYSVFSFDLSDSIFIRNSDDGNERTYRDVSKSVLEDKDVVRCNKDCNILRCTLIEKGEPANVYAPDVTKYYGGSERFVVTLKNDYGNPVANADVKIHINGVDYTRTTNSEGIASMALGLPSNVYEVTTTYGDVIVKSKVTIKDTVFAEDFMKMYKNGTQYSGTFIDTLGRTLPANSPVEININGVFYTRYTDDKGVARMNINLNPGTYVLTAKNPATGEMQATKITVIGTIVENHDLTKYYRNASQYSLRLLDGKGNPVKAGVDIRLNINGVFYTRTSNDDGYVKMNINLEPGEYTITAEYNGLMASNKIKVLSVIETHDLVMKYKDGSKFEAKILDGQGKAYPAQKVTFNINGVFYERITGDDGIARLNINLMAGEYIITSSYNGMNAANKVTISS